MQLLQKDKHNPLRFHSLLLCITDILLPQQCSLSREIHLHSETYWEMEHLAIEKIYALLKIYALHTFASPDHYIKCVILLNWKTIIFNEDWGGGVEWRHQDPPVVMPLPTLRIYLLK